MLISLLGPTEVTGDGTLSRRDRVVLAALVVQGREPASVEVLADALWGEQVPASATKVVQGAVMRLRRVLGTAAIETTSGGYRCTLDGHDIDTHAFDRLVARGRELSTLGEHQRAATTLDEALALWRGAPLPDLLDWDPGRAEADRLLEVRRAAEEELLEERMAAGQAGNAVADTQRLVTREPYREHRWVLLALALYRAGRQRDALDAVRRARTTLVDELGLDPGPELVALEQQILTQDPALLDVPGPAAASTTCPYPGLRPFDAGEAEFYAGREDEVAEHLARLDDFPLLVVVGASGSGKSSLVRAGLGPALRERGDTVVVLTPGTSPEATLTTALAAGDPPDVLVLDQLEELFVPAPHDVDAVLSRLATMVDAGQRVVVTLRADHLADLSRSPALARQVERGLLLLSPMTEEQLRRAIEEPARRSGLRLEPGLVDLLVRDVHGEAGGLPLLSHALAETWTRREGNVLTVDGYTATGGIHGAVAKSADRLYESLGPTDRLALRSVLERLVTPTTAGDPVAARIPTRVFSGTPDAPRLLDLLVRARLVTTTADTTTIAHESLVRAWPRLRSWLEEDADSQRILAHLQVAAEGWDAAERPDDELYRGARLATAIEWRQDESPMLSATERDFLDASLGHRDAQELRRSTELAEQRRRNRQLRWAVGGVAGLLVLALVAGSMAAVRGHQAQLSAAAARTSADAADAARLAASSRAEGRTDLTVLMARQATSLSADPARQGDLLSALVRADVVAFNQAPVRVFDRFSPGFINRDGSRLLVVDGGALLLDSRTGSSVTSQPLAPFDDFFNIVLPAGFVDDGRTAVVARTTPESDPPTREIVRYSARDGQQVGQPEPVPGSRAGDFFGQDLLHISPDGSTLVSALDRRLRVWNWSHGAWTGPRTVALPAFPPSIPGQDLLDNAAFSDDGSIVALRYEYQGPPTWASTATTAIDLRHDRALSPWIVGGRFVAVAPHGDRWATSRLDGTVEVLSTTGGTSLRLPGPKSSGVSALAWSTDGARLLAGDADGSVRVFGLDPLHEIATFAGGGDQVALVGLAADGDTVVSIQQEGQLAVRSLSGRNAVLDVTTTSRASSVAVGGPGTVAAVGLDDGHVEVVDQSSMRAVRRLWLGPYAQPDPTFEPARHRRVTALAVTPDGSTVVAGDRSGHLRAWRVSDGQVMWSRDDIPAEQAAISPDGRTLITVESRTDPNDPAARAPDWDPVSTTVRLWDLASHRQLMEHGLAVDENGSAPKSKMIAFSPDSTLVAVPYLADMVEVFDTGSAELARTITPDDLKLDPGDTEGQGAMAVTFTPDSKTLLVRLSQQSFVVAVDPRTAARVGTPYADTLGDYGTIGFGPGGRWLFSRNPAALVALSSSSHQRLLGPLSLAGDGGEGSMAIGADGYLFAGTETGLVRLDVDPERWERTACELAGRVLTEAEWAQLLPGRPYAPACTDQASEPASTSPQPAGSG